MRLERLQRHLGTSPRDTRAFMREIDTDADGFVTFQEVDDWLALNTIYPEGRTFTVEATVYIARDSDGACLYVGVTGHNITRLHAHAKAAEWWPLAASVELEHQPTRRRAEARERQLIRELAPRFNVVYAVRELA